ncbi:hypothetical protein [Kocuria aegyptia]|uniref:Gram-positive cocci surface proteins LPxTG domain-containing protein n=1 Tax=Kocuria aegyptia TaxID=330943 RepID=A0ABN2KJF4_9MICC
MNTPLWRALLVAPTASAITLCGFTGALAVDVAPDGASPGTSVLITSASPLPTTAPAAGPGRNGGQGNGGQGNGGQGNGGQGNGGQGNGGQGSDGATPGNGHNGNGTQGNGGQGSDGATPGNGHNGNGTQGNGGQGNGGQGSDGATPGNGHNGNGTQGNGGQGHHGNGDHENDGHLPGNSDQGSDGGGDHSNDDATPSNGGSALEHEKDSDSGSPSPAPIKAPPVVHDAGAPAPRPVGVVGLPDTSRTGTGWDHAPQIGSARPVSTVRTSVQDATVMSRSAGAEAPTMPAAAGARVSTSGTDPSTPPLPDSLAYTGVPGGVLSAGGLGALLLALGAALRLKRA